MTTKIYFINQGMRGILFHIGPEKSSGQNFDKWKKISVKTTVPKLRK